MAAASSLAFNRLPFPRLLPLLPRPPAVAVNPLSAARFPRTTAARSDDYYRPSSPSCQNGAYMLKTSVGTPVEPGTYEQRQDARREVWEGFENDDGLYLRFDMPGVGKEDIKVWVEGDKLVMQGWGEKDFEESEFGPSYKYNVQLLEVHLFDTKAVKADMVKGVLKVFVPKL